MPHDRPPKGRLSCARNAGKSTLQRADRRRSVRRACGPLCAWDQYRLSLRMSLHAAILSPTRLRCDAAIEAMSATLRQRPCAARANVTRQLQGEGGVTRSAPAAWAFLNPLGPCREARGAASRALRDRFDEMMGVAGWCARIVTRRAETLLQRLGAKRRVRYALVFFRFVQHITSRKSRSCRAPKAASFRTGFPSH